MPASGPASTVEDALHARDMGTSDIADNIQPPLQREREFSCKRPQSESPQRHESPRNESPPRCEPLSKQGLRPNSTLVDDPENFSREAYDDHHRDAEWRRRRSPPPQGRPRYCNDGGNQAPYSRYAGFQGPYGFDSGYYQSSDVRLMTLHSRITSSASWTGSHLRIEVRTIVRH